MSGAAEKKILSKLTVVEAQLALLLQAKAAEHWPKTVAEYARFRGKTARTVHRWMDEGKLGHTKKAGAQTVITEQQHLAFIGERREALAFR